MGTYVDNCLIWAYSLKERVHINNATNIIENILKNEDLYISTYSLLEMYSFLSRNPTKYKIPPGLEKSNPSKLIKVRIAVEYTLRSLKLNIYEDDGKTVPLGTTKINTHEIFYECTQLAPRIELPSGDLIHATYAYLMKKEGIVNQIATLDNHFEEKKGPIKVFTGLDVIYKN